MTAENLFKKLCAQGVEFFVEPGGRMGYTVPGKIVREVVGLIDRNYDALSALVRAEKGVSAPTNTERGTRPQQAAALPAARAVNLSDDELRAAGLRPWTIDAIRRHVQPSERPRVERDQNGLPDRAYKT